MASNNVFNLQDFITEDQWNSANKFDGSENILKWAEVPTETIFFLSIIEEKQDSKFPSFVLHFCDKNEISYRCFAPSHFIKEIRRRRETDARPYFCSYGTIEHNGKNIAKFEISYKKEGKSWNIFQ